MQLILFPYAGGSGPAYRKLVDQLPKNWLTQTLELPGRGQRLREPLCESVEEMLDDFCTSIDCGPIDTAKPYAFFGHSMGSLLSFMCANRFWNTRKNLPQVLICSGFRALHQPHQRTVRHSLNSTGFRKELRNMGGMPKEILDEVELMDFFEPIIRADFEVCENFQLLEPKPIPIPIHTMFGTEEDLGENDKEEWSRLSTKMIERHDFEGHHFFIFSQAEKVGKTIEEIVTQHLNATEDIGIL